MKRIFSLLIFLAAIFSFTTQVKADETFPDTPEEIIRFDSDITINKDTSLSIIERIVYFAPEDKHGIWRYIPEKYHKNGVIYSNPVSDISVTDLSGQPVPTKIIRGGGNVTVKIGDPNVTFTGARIYIISYKVARAILAQKDFDELYWDITGEGWQFPVQMATASIHSPYAKEGEAVCFTGPVGGTVADCSLTQNDYLIAATKSPVHYGDNFTVSLKLDKTNQLNFPSQIEILIDKFVNNSPLVLLFFPGIIMFIYWYKKGRDFRFVSPNAFNLDPDQPQCLRPIFEPINIPMVYEPLKNLTPGEAGIMLDERVDNQDVIAEIIELARKKYLSIERVENKGFLKFGHDYLFTKFKDGPGDLPPQQEYLMKNIFGSKTQIKLSELKGTFYTHMTKVKEIMSKELEERKLFSLKPEVARGFGIMVAAVLCVIVFIISLESIVFLAAFWPVLLLLVSFGIGLVCAWNMPQKTAVGTNLALQIKGLRETIRLGKWREEIKEKHLFIEEVLPFAMALGVIGKLTRDMAELNIKPPQYMSGGFGADTLAWSGFVSDFSKSAAGGLSYNPSSSSTGGSGFSGGSSGGGGGGGGGGSW